MQNEQEHDMTSTDTTGFCMCGCRQTTKLAEQSRTARGWIKGQPKRFVAGHAQRVQKRPTVGVANHTRVGDRHPLWAGDDASYSTVHNWLARWFTKAGACEECGAEGKTGWSNVDHKYRRVREDYRELCPSCHWHYDQECFGNRFGRKEVAA